MAYLESAVVVYLRLLYYPEGFRFPLTEIPLNILLVEIGREAATILMLWTVARMLGRNGREVFAWFCFNFGVWDIWYYIWLKVLLNWPASLLEWDILFLIPLPWVGPVLAPVLISLALITAGVLILRMERTGRPVRLRRLDWTIEIIAGLIIIFSFLTNLGALENQQRPDHYHWWIFMLGFIPGLLLFLYRVYQSASRKSHVQSD